MVFDDGGSCNPRILELHESLNCGGYSLSFNGTSNVSRTLHTSSYGSCGSQISLNSYNQSISSLTWHHMVITADGNTGEGKLFLDGILVNSVTGPTFKVIFRTTEPIYLLEILHRIDVIGGRKIDDLGLWNRTLNHQEIQQLYNSSFSSGILWSTGQTTSSINVSPSIYNLLVSEKWMHR